MSRNFKGPHQGAPVRNKEPPSGAVNFPAGTLAPCRSLHRDWGNGSPATRRGSGGVNVSSKPCHASKIESGSTPECSSSARIGRSNTGSCLGGGGPLGVEGAKALRRRDPQPPVLTISPPQSLEVPVEAASSTRDPTSHQQQQRQGPEGGATRSSAIEGYQPPALPPHWAARCALLSGDALSLGASIPTRRCPEEPRRRDPGSDHPEAPEGPQQELSGAFAPVGAAAAPSQQRPSVKNTFKSTSKGGTRGSSHSWNKAGDSDEPLANHFRKSREVKSEERDGATGSRPRRHSNQVVGPPNAPPAPAEARHEGQPNGEQNHLEAPKLVPHGTAAPTSYTSSRVTANKCSAYNNSSSDATSSSSTSHDNSSCSSPRCSSKLACSANAEKPFDVTRGTPAGAQSLGQGITGATLPPDTRPCTGDSEDESQAPLAPRSHPLGRPLPVSTSHGSALGTPRKHGGSSSTTSRSESSASSSREQDCSRQTIGSNQASIGAGPVTIPTKAPATPVGSTSGTNSKSTTTCNNNSNHNDGESTTCQPSAAQPAGGPSRDLQQRLRGLVPAGGTPEAAGLTTNPQPGGPAQATGFLQGSTQSGSAACLGGWRRLQASRASGAPRWGSASGVAAARLLSALGRPGMGLRRVPAKDNGDESPDSSSNSCTDEAPKKHTSPLARLGVIAEFPMASSVNPE